MTTATFPSVSAGQFDVGVVEAVATDIVAPKPNHRGLIVASIVWVSVAFLFLVGVPMAMYLDDWTGGMGLGAFTAFWGGPSFGFMAGMARVSAWEEKYGADH